MKNLWSSPEALCIPQLVEITYIDALNNKLTEQRCELCSKSLKSNIDNTIVNKTKLIKDTSGKSALKSNTILPHSGTNLIK